jgi:hypothetical protein
MSEFKITGTIVEIYETASFGTSGFKKREFVLEYAENPSYPEFIKLEVIQDKCDLLNNLNKGQKVDVNYNLKGRKWTNPKGEEVYFNTIQAWRVVESVEPHDITPEFDVNQASATEPDDLPF